MFLATAKSEIQTIHKMMVSSRTQGVWSPSNPFCDKISCIVICSACFLVPFLAACRRFISTSSVQDLQQEVDLSIANATANVVQSVWDKLGTIFLRNSRTKQVITPFLQLGWLQFHQLRDRVSEIALSMLCHRRIKLSWRCEDTSLSVPLRDVQ